MMDVLHNGRSKQNHLGGTTMVSSIFSMNIYSKDLYMQCERIQIKNITNIINDLS